MCTKISLSKKESISCIPYIELTLIKQFVEYSFCPSRGGGFKNDCFWRRRGFLRVAWIIVVRWVKNPLCPSAFAMRMFWVSAFTMRLYNPIWTYIKEEWITIIYNRSCFERITDAYTQSFALQTRKDGGVWNFLLVCLFELPRPSGTPSYPS